MHSSLTGFILDSWYTTYRSTTLFAIGKAIDGSTFGLVEKRFPLRFFIRSSDLERARTVLKQGICYWESTDLTTMDLESVIAIMPFSRRSLQTLTEDLARLYVRTYEADMEFSNRILMEHGIHRLVTLEGRSLSGKLVDNRFINPSLLPAKEPIIPPLLTLVIDIETDRDASEIYAVSLVDLRGEIEEIFVVTNQNLGMHVHNCKDEKDLLEKFKNRIIDIDPDIITGWNVIDFDFATLNKLFRKFHIPFVIGRTDEEAYYRKGDNWGESHISIRGRQILDGLQLVRHSLNQFEDYRLNTVANEILGRGKILQQEEWEDAPEAIEKTYREDLPSFCEYCLEDSRLVRDILLKQDLIQLTAQRAVSTGLSIERAWRSVAAFDFIYTSQLRKKLMVAPTNGVDQIKNFGAPGGLVMEPVTGHHQNILVFDFKSLYPSLIRTFNLDPLANIAAKKLPEEKVICAPNGERFSRETTILPPLLDHLHSKRNLAKKEGDQLRSFTFKIIMNSFYGVMGSAACRFRCGNLAGAVTGFGQHFLSKTRSWFEEQGYKVLYGDTDSLFIDIQCAPDKTPDEIRAIGDELSKRANKAIEFIIKEEYQLESKLELEFEKFYKHLIFPPARAGIGSRAKSYAGLRISNNREKLEIIGLEAIRSDWTKIAQEFQRTLLTMLFSGDDSSSIEKHIQNLITNLKKGLLDEELIYRKRIRKPLSSYTKTTPPHVRAARQLPRQVSVVRYLITIDGPQPLGFVKSPLDYNHYIEKQLKPIAESLGAFGGFNPSICSPRPIQETLFDF